MTRICSTNLTIVGSDKGLTPGRCQAIIWTNAVIYSIGLLIKIEIFSFMKMPNFNLQVNFIWITVYLANKLYLKSAIILNFRICTFGLRPILVWQPCSPLRVLCPFFVYLNLFRKFMWWHEKSSWGEKGFHEPKLLNLANFLQIPKKWSIYTRNSSNPFINMVWLRLGYR